jgi:hypothetical protein
MPVGQRPFWPVHHHGHRASSQVGWLTLIISSVMKPNSPSLSLFLSLFSFFIFPLVLPPRSSSFGWLFFLICIVYLVSHSLSFSSRLVLSSPRGRDAL